MISFASAPTAFPPVATDSLTYSSAATLTKEQVLQRNNVRIIGQGKPPLLLCNGFGYNQRLWQPLVAGLAQQHQVILFDHVGTGESDSTAYDKYAHLGGYAQDLLDICRVLELEGATLVGHSVGSTIALLAAGQTPAYFAQAVLLTPSPCYLNAPGYYGGYERADLEQMLALLAADYRGWATMFVDLLLGPRASSGLAEELHHYLSSVASPVAQQFAGVTFLSDHRADVPRLHLPTLVVQCQEDFIAPAEVGSYLVAHLPNAQLVTLSAAGHCPQLSAPLETLAALQTFLSCGQDNGSQQS